MKKQFSRGISVLLLSVICSVCFFSVANAEENKDEKGILSQIPMPALVEVPELPSPVPQFLRIFDMVKEPAAQAGLVFRGLKDDFSRDIVAPIKSLPVETLVDISAPLRKTANISARGISIASSKLDNTYASLNFAFSGVLKRNEKAEVDEFAAVSASGFLQKVWDAMIEKTTDIFSDSVDKVNIATSTSSVPKKIQVNNQTSQNSSIVQQAVISGANTSLLLRTIAALTLRIDSLESRGPAVVNNYYSQQTESLGDSIGRLISSNNTNVINNITNVSGGSTYDESSVDITGGSITGVNATTTDLDIQGGLTFDGQSGSSGQILVSTGTGTTPVWQSVTAGATSTDGLPEGTTNLYSQFFTSGSDIYFNTGKIGIGTTTPTAALDVVGDISAHGVISSIGTAGKAAQLYLSDDVNGYGGVDIYSYGGGSTPHSYVNLVGSRGTESAVSNLQAGDDLGMLNFYGQTSSGLELGAAVGAVAAANFSGSNVPTDLFFITSKVERLRVSSSGNVGIGITNPSQKLDIGGNVLVGSGVGSAYVYLRDEYNYIYNADGLPVDIKGHHGVRALNDLGEVARFGISGGSLDSYFNGNVGIGTTAPVAKLQIIGTGEQLRIGYDASNYWTATTSSAGVTTFNAFGSGARFDFADDVKFSTVDDNAIFFSTDGYLDDEAGNFFYERENYRLGVGNTGSPVYLGGSIGMGSGYNSVDLQGASSAGYGTIFAEPYGSDPAVYFNNINAGGTFDFYNGDGSNVITQLGPGNLKVYVQGVASEYLNIGADSGGVISFNAVGSNAAFNFLDNVGIGTTTPGSALSIVNQTASDPILQLFAKAGQTGDLLSMYDATSTKAISFTSNAANENGIVFTTSRYSNRESKIYTKPDTVNGYNDMYIAGNGGRLFLGASGAGFYAVDFGNTSYLTNVPYDFRLTTGADSYIASGLQSTVISAGNAGDGNLSFGANTILGRYNANSGNRSLNFKSYAADADTYKLSAAYVFNTATSSDYLTTLAQTQWQANGTALMTLTGGGNLGIGTTTPGQKFVVSGASQFMSHVGINGAPDGSTAYLRVYGDTLPAIRFDANSGVAALSMGSSGELQVDAAGVVGGRLIVKDSGNVGIGRADPIVRLNTHGAATAYTSKTGLFAITTPTLSGFYNSQLLFGIDNTTNASVGQGYIQMYETATDSYQNLLLNPNGGGVAIGTSLADTALSVGNNGNTYLKLANTSGYGGNGGATPYAGMTFQVASNNNSNYQKGGIVFKTTEDSNGYARGQLRFLLNGSANNSNVQDTVDTSSIMTLDYSGNVGIGTTTPSEKLAVVGKGVFASSTSSQRILIDPTGRYQYDNMGTYYGAQPSITFFDSTNAFRGHIAVQDNEGALNIQARGSGSLILADYSARMASNDTTKIAAYTGLGNAELVVKYDSIRFNFGADTNEKMRLTNEGYLGIGTTTPSKNLVASGTVQFANITGGTLIADAVGNITASSDETLKDISGEFTRGLEDIMKINPISYHWKESTGYDTGNLYSGFSAQNVQLAIPEAVLTNSAGFLTLQDRPILAAAINAIKELGSVFSKFENGIAYIKDVVAEKFTIGTSEKPAGITIYDQATGQPFCIKVLNGVMMNAPGTCDDVTPPPAPTLIDTAPSAGGENPTENSTTTIDTPVGTSTPPVDIPVVTPAEEVVPTVDPEPEPIVTPEPTPEPDSSPVPEAMPTPVVETSPTE